MNVPDNNARPDGTVNTSKDFDPLNYANINSDVTKTLGNDPYKLALHWVTYGQGEQRSYLQNKTADYSAVVQVDDLNTILNSTDISVDGGELSLTIGPVYKTFSSGNNIASDSNRITKLTRVNPLLKIIIPDYPKTFQYSGNSILKLSPIDLDLTNYNNFYIELDGTQYYADSVIDPVIKLIPDGSPNVTGETAKLIQSYWGKTGNIYIKSKATVISTGQITSYPSIANSSSNKYLYDIVEFTNKLSGIISDKAYKYYLTTYKYKNSSTIKAFFQTNIPTYSNGIPKPGSVSNLVLFDTATTPLWLIGTSVFSKTLTTNHYSVPYRTIKYVCFNSVNNKQGGDTSFTGITLNPIYYNDTIYNVDEETTWWIYMDNPSPNNKITPIKCPDYGSGNEIPTDTIDIVYGLSDKANKALFKALDKFLKNNEELLTLSGGNLSNIQVTNTGNKGEITFINFIQTSDISIDLFNDLEDLNVWGITGSTTKYNTKSKSFLDITVKYEIDALPEENEDHEHYNIWGKIIELKSISSIVVNTYTSFNTKSSVTLIPYPVFYTNIPITPESPGEPYTEKWYTNPVPIVSTDNEYVQNQTVYTKDNPFKYMASLKAYVYSVTPFVFNLPRLLVSETNLYKNDSTKYDLGFTALDGVLNSQINYANSYAGLNDILTGKDGASLDLISLVDRSKAAINVINITGNPSQGSLAGPNIDMNYSNIVYPNPIYDFDTYNLPVGGIITILTAYNYTVVPLLSQTNTILALSETYRHYKIEAPTLPV